MFDGVDVPAIRTELEEYVRLTEPQNLSTPGFITLTSGPACGRPKAVELTERVLPILGALYPTWRDENPANDQFEFGAIRDACSRLLARIASHRDVAQMLGDRVASPQMAAAALHDLVWNAASAQWSTGHRQEAVLAAAKAVNSMLQTKLGRRDLSDAKLVREAFSDAEASLTRRRLQFSTIRDDQTRESMRLGVMQFGAGCFQAIRNPVGHLPNDELELSEQEALERLAALSLLARWIDEAEVVPTTFVERFLEMRQRPPSAG